MPNSRTAPVQRSAFSLLICSGFALVRGRTDVLPRRRQDDNCEDVLIAQYGFWRTWRLKFKTWVPGERLWFVWSSNDDGTVSSRKPSCPNRAKRARRHCQRLQRCDRLRRRRECIEHGNRRRTNNCYPRLRPLLLPTPQSPPVPLPPLPPPP